MKNLLVEKKKVHIGVWLIFFGMIFLFMGKGANIQIANNAPFFIAAVACNFWHIVYNNKKLKINYIAFFLLVLLVFDVFYIFIGEYDSGVAIGLGLSICLILSTVNIGYNDEDIKLIINGLIYSSVIFAVLLLIFGKGYSGDMYEKMTYTQTFGERMEFEPNFLAFMLITGFEFSVFAAVKSIESKKEGNSVLYIIFAGLTFIAALFTGSRSTLVTACIYGFLLILFMKNSKTKTRLLIIIALLILFLIIAVNQGIISNDIYKRLFGNSYQDDSNMKRLKNWQFGLMAMQNGVLGNGPFESYKISYRLYGYDAAVHNTFIAFGAYFGVIGFLTIVVLIVGLAVSAWRLKQKELFAMIVSMVFEWNILECQHSLAMWMFLLICIMIINKLKRNEEVHVF